MSPMKGSTMKDEKIFASMTARRDVLTELKEKRKTKNSCFVGRNYEILVPKITKIPPTCATPLTIPTNTGRDQQRKYTLCLAE